MTTTERSQQTDKTDFHYTITLDTQKRGACAPNSSSTTTGGDHTATILVKH